MNCKHGVKFCQICVEGEIAELRALLERERVISGGLREDRDGIVKNWREVERELEKARARSDRMAAGLRELYRTLPAGEHLGIVTGLMSDWHPWPETETVIATGAPRLMGIEGATFEDVWSDADASPTKKP